MTAVAAVQTSTAAKSVTMKAIVQDRYGSPDVLRMSEIPKPVPGDEQVLVRVRASSVNALDWHELRAEPLVVRITEGWRRPKQPVRGVDVAGVVEAIGAKITHLKVGDEVFGARNGAFAEYVAGRTMVRKPTNLTFEQAAAIPVAGTTALQALTRKGQLKPGQRVLVTGAGGGVGSFAVQIAKALGGEVTAETRTEFLDLVRSLGADNVVDYAREDITRSDRRFDLICDVAGYAPLSKLERLIAPGGALVLVGAGRGRGISPLLRMAGGFIRPKLTGKRVLAFLADVNRDDLLVLKDLVEAGKVTPVIDRTYPLSEVPEAMRRIETGDVRGKVVIAI